MGKRERISPHGWQEGPDNFQSRVKERNEREMFRNVIVLCGTGEKRLPPRCPYNSVEVASR